MSGNLVLITGPNRTGVSTVAGLMHEELDFTQYYATTDVLQPTLKSRQPWRDIDSFNREELGVMATILRTEHGPEFFAQRYMAMAGAGLKVVVDKPRNYWEVKEAIAHGATLIGFTCSDDERRFGHRHSVKDPDTLEQFLAQESREDTDPHTNPIGMHQGAIAELVPHHNRIDVTKMTINDTFTAVREIVFPGKQWYPVDN